LTLRDNPDPLRDDPIAHVDESCVGCGVCGEVAHAAVLCPSFYEMKIVTNPSRWARLVARIRMAVIDVLAGRTGDRWAGELEARPSSARQVGSDPRSLLAR
jgi:indolepyruvate ferredoxin oxidoreductase alpha subunit